MSAEMPVTNRHIVIDNGSTNSAAGTCKEPTLIQLKRWIVISRSEWRSNKKKAITAKTKESATTPVAIAPMAFSLSAGPITNTKRYPTRGMSKRRVARGAISALQLSEVVHRRGGAAAKDGDNNARGRVPLCSGH